MITKISKVVVASALVLATMAGCKDKDKDQAGQATTHSGSPASADPDMAVWSIFAVDIDTKLASMCGLPESKVFFKFDSAKLEPEAKERLQQIAACAVSGAAKGKDLVAIGRTDATGSDDYNKQLGMSRADSVAKYLREQGVAGARVATDSKGEAAAASSASYGWPYDRRVTIRLQP